MVEKRMKIFDKYLDKGKLVHQQYQKDGVRWILENEMRREKDTLFGVRGGFIADEMGLGKTIMLIGTMLANYVPRTLVVVPLALMDQWYDQILRTTGHRAILFHGENKKRVSLDQLETSKVVITTYGAICVPRGEKSGCILHTVFWGRVVFDEAHHLRNANTNNYYGASLLNAGIRWLVSGTPIQNRREDMYNLCRLLRIPYKDPDSRLDILRNFVLRRTKKEVGILLPDVVEDMNVVSWNNEREKKLAESIHSKLSICRKEDKDTDKDKKDKDTADKDKKDEPNKENVLDFTPLQAMLKARQCCILPRLVQANPSVSSSSKLDFVVGEILRNKGNGSGKLIFCHFREELDEICKRLTASGLNGVACIDSRTSDVRRKQCLVENNEALVLQIQTGCEGLNLQEHYSEIYFVGPHWNPAIEDQAVARCHRFGQTRVVYVRRFEMASFGNQDINIERYVHNVQESKRIMAQEYFP